MVRMCDFGRSARNRGGRSRPRLAWPGADPSPTRSTRATPRSWPTRTRSSTALRAAGRPVWHDGLDLWLAVRHADADAVLRERRLGRLFSRARSRPTSGRRSTGCTPTRSSTASRPSTPGCGRWSPRRSPAATSSGCGPRVARPRRRPARRRRRRGPATASVDLVADYAEPLPVMVIAELLGVPEADRPAAAPVVAGDREDVRVRPHARQRGRRPRDRRRRVPSYVAELAAPPPDRPGRRPGQPPGVGRGRRFAAVRARAGGAPACCCSTPATRPASTASATGWPRCSATPTSSRGGRGPVGGCADRGGGDAAVRRTAAAVRADGQGGRGGRRRALRAGDKVAALLGSANRDPEVFAEPDRMDVLRDPNPHIGFGAGIHFCLGAPLARLELQASLPAAARALPAAAPGRRARAAPDLRPARLPLPPRSP